MHRPIFGHSFAVLAAPILLSVLAFKFLNKKKTGVGRHAEDADAGVSSLSTETNLGGSSSSAAPNAGVSSLSAETNLGAASLLVETNLGASSSSAALNTGVSSLSAESNLGASSSSAAPIEISSGIPSSSTMLTGNHYDVFLSFRGKDTRYGFTSHLYNGLLNAGIHTFKDNNELREGEEIGPDLLTAIKNSKIPIVILSVDYGSSKWCLDELVQIMLCKNKSKGRLVLPIFYKVEPAHVRHQIGSFGEAFHRREGRFDSATLKKWKQALEEVSNLKGWEATGDEGELVKLVVQKVLSQLKKEFHLVTPEILVGIDSHVEKVMKLVDNSATQFVGIHGMGGIGKTTLAKTIYNKLSNQFEYCSYIPDIRELFKSYGIVFLQNQLILDILNQKRQVNNEDEGINFLSSNFKSKKVLILLDNVDDDGQLKALAGNHDWFSLGSRILITTRKGSVLDNRVDFTYELEEMNMYHSMILFSRHAFRSNSPPTKFEDLAFQVVSTTGGLPLALEVLGSYFCGKTPTQWRGTIKKLRKVPRQEVQDRLKISYDALDRRQQQIFLDIACFLIGTDRRSTSYMWDACDFYADDSIEVLRFMSLIKIGDNQELRMHDQLRDLGREIVRKENPAPQYRSRLWDSEEILKVLEGNKGTDKIEAISLSKGSLKGSGETANQGGYIHTNEQFKNLTSLRFLHVNKAHFVGDFNKSFEELTYLRWQNCPLTFEASNFSIKELVVLDLSGSQISDEWQGWSSINTAKELKFLDLTSCESLRSTIFLSAFKNLEFLILRDCRKLEKIDCSIGDMELKFLDLTSCDSLRSMIFLPAFKNLEFLILRDCRRLEQIDSSIGDVKLKFLDLTSCESIRRMFFLSAFKNLKILILRDCRRLEQINSSIGDMKLKYLDLTSCESLRSTVFLSAFANLEVLIFRDCEELEKIDSSIGEMKSLVLLDLTRCRSLKGLPVELGKLGALEQLLIKDCPYIFVIPNIGTLQNLEILHICGTGIKELPNGVERLRNLRDLDASRCKRLRGEMLESFRNLVSLQHLDFDGCKELQSLPELPSNLTYLSITCHSRILPSLSHLTHLKELRLLDCRFLECFQLTDAEESESTKSPKTPFKLEILKIYGCKFMETLDVSKLIHLRILSIENCNSMFEVRGLDNLTYLESLTITRCASIIRLDLPKSEHMKILDTRYCENLVNIQGLYELEFMEKLYIPGCISIEGLDLSKSRGLKISRS